MQKKIRIYIYKLRDSDGTVTRFMEQMQQGLRSQYQWGSVPLPEGLLHRGVNLALTFKGNNRYKRSSRSALDSSLPTVSLSGQHRGPGADLDK